MSILRIDIAATAAFLLFTRPYRSVCQAVGSGCMPLFALISEARVVSTGSAGFHWARNNGAHPLAPGQSRHRFFTEKSLSLPFSTAT